MKKDYGQIPATREEAIQIAMSINEEDIDTSDMPDRGGATDWYSRKDRLVAEKQHKQLA
ncbi:MAG: hypothetical protein LBQ58_11970 [Synergistaceae bacterium]|jgi:hypothetical protein|nr:hypothetical protein [Synergistaceae bacterium]